MTDAEKAIVVKALFEIGAIDPKDYESPALALDAAQEKAAQALVDLAIIPPRLTPEPPPPAGPDLRVVK